MGSSSDDARNLLALLSSLRRKKRTGRDGKGERRLTHDTTAPIVNVYAGHDLECM